MYARLMAFSCLLSVGAFAGSLDRANEGSRGIVIHVRHLGDVPAALADAMRAETSAQMQKGGYRLQWVETPREVTAAFLVVLTLEGNCAADSLPSGVTKILASRGVTEVMLSTNGADLFSKNEGWLPKNAVFQLFL